MLVFYLLNSLSLILIYEKRVLDIDIGFLALWVLDPLLLSRSKVLITSAQEAHYFNVLKFGQLICNLIAYQQMLDFNMSSDSVVFFDAKILVINSTYFLEPELS